MGRRLLQGLQQGVEAVGGEHVHLVDEVHLVAAAGGQVLDVVEHLPGVFHLGAGRGVHLQQVDETALGDGPAGAALTAGGGADAALAVEALGDDPRQGGLAHAPGAGEEIGVVQAPVVEAVDQGLQHMLLPHHLVEGAGAPFAGEDLIAHGQPAWETSGALYGHGPGVSRHGARPRRRELPGKGISANPSPGRRCCHGVSACYHGAAYTTGWTTVGAQRDKGNTLERIIKAAEGEFAARGFEAANIENIAREARVTKQLVYHYFRTKDQLYRATLETVSEGMGILDDAQSYATLAPRDAIARLINTIIDDFISHPSYAALTLDQALHHGEHITQSSRFIPTMRATVDQVFKPVLER